MLTPNTMKAWALDARLRTSLAIPTDLDAVTQTLGIHVMETNELPERVLGMHLMHDNGASIVAIRPELTNGCRRFTVAHEICHHLIDRVQKSSATSTIARSRIDTLCNQFAAELLMPAPDVELHAPYFAYGLKEEQLRLFADRFEVTAGAMGVRLRELQIPAWWWAEQGNRETLSQIYLGLSRAK